MATQEMIDCDVHHAATLEQLIAAFYAQAPVQGMRDQLPIDGPCVHVDISNVTYKLLCKDEVLRPILDCLAGALEQKGVDVKRVVHGTIYRTGDDEQIYTIAVEYEARQEHVAA